MGSALFFNLDAQCDAIAPTSDQSVTECVADDVTFGVTFDDTDGPLNIQWQVDEGSGFVDIGSSPIIGLNYSDSGPTANPSTLTVTGILNTYNGFVFKALSGCGNGGESPLFTLEVNGAVTVTPISPSGATTFCDDETTGVTLSSTSSDAGSNGASIIDRWQYRDGTSGAWTNIAGAAGSQTSLDVNPGDAWFPTPGTDRQFRYRARVDGCNFVSTAPETVSVGILPEIEPIADVTICDGATLTDIAPLVAGTDNGASTSYVWSGSGMVNLDDDEIANPIYTANGTGSQTLTLTVDNGNGCTDVASVNVFVEDLSLTSGSGSETVICFGEDAEFVVTSSSSNPSAVVEYVWDINGTEIDSQTGATATFTEDDHNNEDDATVTVTVTTDGGCEEILSYNLNVNGAITIGTPPADLLDQCEDLETATFDIEYTIDNGDEEVLWQVSATAASGPWTTVNAAFAEGTVTTTETMSTLDLDVAALTLGAGDSYYARVRVRTVEGSQGGGNGYCATDPIWYNAQLEFNPFAEVDVTLMPDVAGNAGETHPNGTIHLCLGETLDLTGTVSPSPYGGTYSATSGTFGSNEIVLENDWTGDVAGLQTITLTSEDPQGVCEAEAKTLDIVVQTPISVTIDAELNECSSGGDVMISLMADAALSIAGADSMLVDTIYDVTAVPSDAGVLIDPATSVVTVPEGYVGVVTVVVNVGTGAMATDPYLDCAAATATMTVNVDGLDVTQGTAIAEKDICVGEGSATTRFDFDVATTPNDVDVQWWYYESATATDSILFGGTEPELDGITLSRFNSGLSARMTIDKNNTGIVAYDGYTFGANFSTEGGCSITGNFDYTINVNYIEPVDAGDDLDVCATDETVTLPLGDADGGTWTGGDVSDNVYTFGSDEGVVTLTYTRTDDDGLCAIDKSDAIDVNISSVVYTTSSPSDLMSQICEDATSAFVAYDFTTALLYNATTGSGDTVTWEYRLNGGTITTVNSGAGSMFGVINESNVINNSKATLFLNGADFTDLAAESVLELRPKLTIASCADVVPDEWITLTIRDLGEITFPEPAQVCEFQVPFVLEPTIEGTGYELDFATFDDGGNGGAFTDNGDGTYNYLPAAGTEGTVTITVESNDPDGDSSSSNNNGCGIVTASVDIYVFGELTLDAGDDQTICSDTPVQLDGTVGGFSFTWVSPTDPTGAAFSDPNNVDPVYTFTAMDIINGSVTLTLKSDGPVGPNQECPEVTDEVTITIDPMNMVDAGTYADVNCTEASIDLVNATKNDAVQTSVWSSANGNASDFNNPNLLNPTYTFTAADYAAGKAELTLESTNNINDNVCANVSSTVTINILQVGSVVLSSDKDEVCDHLAVALSATVTDRPGSSGSWTFTGASGSFINGTTTGDNVSFEFTENNIQSGTAVFTYTNSTLDACMDIVETIEIDYNREVSAGYNLVACLGDTIMLGGSFGGAVTSVEWSVDPSDAGEFVNGGNEVANAQFRVDIPGNITFTITSNPQSGACASVTDETIVFVNNTSIVSPMVGDTMRAYACSGDAVSFDMEVTDNTGDAFFDNYQFYKVSIAPFTGSSPFSFSFVSGQPPYYWQNVGGVLEDGISTGSLPGYTVSLSGTTVTLQVDEVGADDNNVTFIGSNFGFCESNSGLFMINTPQEVTFSPSSVGLTGNCSDLETVTIDAGASFTPNAAPVAPSMGFVTSDTTYAWSFDNDGTTGSLDPSEFVEDEATLTPVSAAWPVGISSVDLTLTVTTTIDNGDGPFTCSYESDPITFSIDELSPEADAGADINVCAADVVVGTTQFTLAGAVGPAANTSVTGEWTVLTGGTVNNPSFLGTYYEPTATDLTRGFVEIELATVSALAGACDPAKDTMIISFYEATIGNVIPGNATNIRTVCEGANPFFQVDYNALHVDSVGVVWESSDGTDWTVITDGVSSEDGTPADAATRLSLTSVTLGMDGMMYRATLTAGADLTDTPCTPLVQVFGLTVNEGVVASVTDAEDGALAAVCYDDGDFDVTGLGTGGAFPTYTYLWSPVEADGAIANAGMATATYTPVAADSTRGYVILNVNVTTPGGAACTEDDAEVMIPIHSIRAPAANFTATPSLDAQLRVRVCANDEEEVTLSTNYTTSGVDAADVDVAWFYVEPNGTPMMVDELTSFATISGDDLVIDPAIAGLHNYDFYSVITSSEDDVDVCEVSTDADPFTLQVYGAITVENNLEDHTNLCQSTTEVLLPTNVENDGAGGLQLRWQVNTSGDPTTNSWATVVNNLDTLVADISGLAPGDTWYYRLRARTAVNFPGRCTEFIGTGEAGYVTVMKSADDITEVAVALDSDILCNNVPGSYLLGVNSGATVSTTGAATASAFWELADDTQGNLFGASTIAATQFVRADEMMTGDVVFYLLSQDLGGACGQDTATFTLTYEAPIIVDAGPDVEVCFDGYTMGDPIALGDVSIEGAVDTGTWVSSVAGVVDTMGTEIRFTPDAGVVSAGSVVTLTLTSARAADFVDPLLSTPVCPVVMDMVDIILNESIEDIDFFNPASLTREICAGENTNFTVRYGSVLADSVVWLVTTDGVETPILASNAQYTTQLLSSNVHGHGVRLNVVAANDTLDGVTFRVKLFNGACEATQDVDDQFTLDILNTPEPNAGDDVMVCYDEVSYDLTGSNDAGDQGTSLTYSWSGGTPTGFSDATVLYPTYTFDQSEIDAGSVTLTLEIDNGSCSATDEITITIGNGIAATGYETDGGASMPAPGTSTVCSGDGTTFKVNLEDMSSTVGNLDNPVYTWQVSYDNGTSYSDLDASSVGVGGFSVAGNVGSSTLTLTDLTSGAHEALFQLVVTDEGCDFISDAFTLEVETTGSCSVDADLTMAIRRPSNPNFVTGEIKEGYVQIRNIGTESTTGNIVFTIPKLLQGFEVVVPETMAMSAGATVVNGDYTITSDFLEFEIQGVNAIAPGGIIRIGFTLEAIGAAGGTATLTTGINSAEAGGDSNLDNNNAVKTFRIQ